MNATLFAALGEPSRLKIVELLRHRPFSVGDIADTLGIRQPQASKHLKVLREAGLVDVEPIAQKRIYRLEPEPFEALTDWTRSFEALWQQRLDALGDVLTTMPPPPTNATSLDDHEEAAR